MRKIKKGKYARFDKLLSPVDDLLTVTGGKQQKKKNTRQVCDLGSWLEAWNIFIALRVQIAPATALELVKYQSIVCQLFAIHSAAAALKYDKLFRQAAARDRQQSLRWDALKEDLLVWCVTNPPFRSRPLPPTNPRTTTSTGVGPSTHPGGSSGSSHHATHTPSGEEICRRFNFGKCTKGAECTFAHKCSVTGCSGNHPAKACTRVTSGAT